MNKLSAFILAALAFAFATASNEAAAQAAGGTPSSYGAPITADGAMHISHLPELMSNTDSLAVKVDCEIITSCTKKGFWMDVKLPDGSAMKVRFKDYGFFVPLKGLEGKRAVLQGGELQRSQDRIVHAAAYAF